MAITEEDIRIMEECAQRSHKELAQWWCLLNSWEWPIELPNPEADVHAGGNSNPRRSALMAWIDGRIGHRIISRVWNFDMTDDEHEDFWRGNFERNAAAKKRDQERTDRLIESGRIRGQCMDALRANVYADWLESRGHHAAAKELRAEFPLEELAAVH